MAAAVHPIDGRAARILTWCAIVVAVAADLVYVAIVYNFGTDRTGISRVVFVAAYLLLMALLLLGSLAWRLPATPRMALRAAAAGGLLVLGVLAAFSIGVPIIIGGILAATATVRTLAGPHLTMPALSTAAAAIVSVAVLVGGFEVTERMIFCPAHGFEAGSGYGLVSGGYHYYCVDGRLEFFSGFCASGGATVDPGGHIVPTGGC